LGTYKTITAIWQLEDNIIIATSSPRVAVNDLRYIKFPAITHVRGFHEIVGPYIGNNCRLVSDNYCARPFSFRDKVNNWQNNFWPHHAQIHET